MELAVRIISVANSPVFPGRARDSLRVPQRRNYARAANFATMSAEDLVARTPAIARKSPSKESSAAHGNRALWWERKLQSTLLGADGGQESQPFKKFRIALYTAAAVLVLAIAHAYAVFVYARIQIGYWPSYNHPDSAVQLDEVHRAVAIILIEVALWLAIPTVAAYLVAAAVWLWDRVYLGDVPRKTLPLLPALVWTAVIVIVAADPAKVLVWLMD
ncbi:MAG: hypothetical protein L0Z55_07205 [Planctomycetes bacterium]|nr:hypothetical protein [Planctomycetota bacterium]